MGRGQGSPQTAQRVTKVGKRRPKPTARRMEGLLVVSAAEVVATNPDGILRQKDVALPKRIHGHSFVYQLLDPITCKPRYIGLTNAPCARLGTYRQKSRSDPRSVSVWWREMMERTGGHPPVMRIIQGPIEDDVDARPSEQAEAYWERVHRDAGIVLLNDVACGGGRPLGGGFWTLEMAKEEVKKLNADLNLGQCYPMGKQFDDNGLGGLHAFIVNLPGGHRDFAAKMGLEMAGGKAWDEQGAFDAVVAMNSDRGFGKFYPTMAQFDEAGLGGLYSVIPVRFGGHRAFAAKLGLEMKNHERWSETKARKAVLNLTANLGLGRGYPIEKQFVEGGLRGAYTPLTATRHNSDSCLQSHS